MKHDDEWGVHGCHQCHLMLDGPESDLPEAYDTIFMRALMRTREHQRRAIGLELGKA